MSRKATLPTLAFVFLVCFIAGCSDAQTDSKQPKLQDTPDPKIKGPSKPVGGVSNKPAAVK